jgi:hypothetical protein
MKSSLCELVANGLDAETPAVGELTALFGPIDQIGAAPNGPGSITRFEDGEGPA